MATASEARDLQACALESERADLGGSRLQVRLKF